MRKSIKILNVIIILCLICCKRTNVDNNFYSLIIGDWKDITHEYGNCNYEMNNGGYTFLADKTVDLKRAIYAYEIWESYDGVVDSVMYKGTFANYKIILDSLKIQNPKNLTWYNRKIISISKDTMILSGGNCWEKFVRINYQLDTMPVFDKIIVSTTYPPLGKFPTFDVMISSNGEVVYLGEVFADKQGFYTSKISISDYQIMQDNFRKADIKNIKKPTFASLADQQSRYATFVKANKIYRAHDGHHPNELYWATIPLENLPNTTLLTKISENDSAFYLSNTYFQYKLGNKVMDMAKSECFLLWDYLRNGKWTTKSFTKRFELDFEGDYIFKPSSKPMQAYKVKRIETDGQFYKLYMVGKLPITIDIGNNFFDNNFTETSFSLKKVYY